MPEKDPVRELIVELTKALPGYTPLETPNETSLPAMRFALASMYKDKGFRDYLIRAIRLNLEGFQSVIDDRGLWVQQGRLLVLKELLAMSKKMFQESEEIKKTFSENTEKGIEI